MKTDIWHYPRTELVEKVLNMFECGLSCSLTFFAPRRMGKTEFLCKDIMPLAQSRNWKVLYFSFIDVGNDPTIEFTHALTNFSENISKTSVFLKKISKLSGEVIGMKGEISFDSNRIASMKEIISKLAAKYNILLLLDEIQILASDNKNSQFIASLRTMLDIHKDTVKVIFTGSSQEELRRMFSHVKAPFFHFGTDLPFPELDRGFTDHIAKVFSEITGRNNFDKQELWLAFQELQKIPLLLRALVERLISNPDLSLKAVKEQLLSEYFLTKSEA